MDDRAQILLIGGFIVAFGLVAITIMFNNIIYASNMASEAGMEIAKPEILNIREDASREAWHAANASVSGGSYSQTYINEHMSAYGAAMTKHYATRGQSLHVSVSNLTEPYYTEEGTMNGTVNRTIAFNINKTNTFNITFDKDSLVVASDIGDAVNNSAFMVVAINQTTWIWAMFVWHPSDDSSDIFIQTFNSSMGNWTGAFSDNGMSINVLEGLGFKESVGTNYSLLFQYGNNAAVSSNRPAGTHGYEISGQTMDGGVFNETRDVRLDVTIYIRGGPLNYNASASVVVPS